MNFLEELALTTVDHVALLFEEHPFEELIDVLREADDDYTNGVEPDLSDAQYDAIRRQAELIQPHHVYFTGVGSEVRGGKVKLPHPMGSLNQKFEGDIAGWVTKHNLEESRFLITDKLDGVSAMTIYNNGTLQIAYSRGDGIEGADITRHLKNIVPTNISHTTNIAIRGEVIISKMNFDYHIQPKLMSRSNKPYKNSRNCIAGLLNSESIPNWVYQYIDYIAYDIIKS